MTAQFGVNTDVPLTRTEPTMLAITPTALAAGTTSNYAPIDAETSTSFADAQTILQATNVSGSTIAGLDASEVADGQYVVVQNVGPGTLTIAHNSGTEANRVLLPGDEDMPIGAGASIMLIRDGAAARWRLGSGGAGALLDGSVTEGKLDDDAVATDKIQDNAVTLDKLAEIATARILGRSTAGTGNPEALTGTQATALLDAFTTDAKGLVPPASGGNTTRQFVRKDGTWAAPWLEHASARDYGAIGDGSTDSSAAIRDALIALAAQGKAGKLLLPPNPDGTEAVYVVSRQGGNSWCIDLPAMDRLTIEGVPGLSRIKMVEDAASGLAPNTPVALLRCTNNTNLTIRGITFDGNWGNPVTTVTVASEGDELPQATINVESTEPDGCPYPDSGTVYIRTTDGLQTITYTGRTATTFTGCTGGTGILQRGAAVGWEDSNAGLNQEDQADPKNYLLWLYRGCKNVVVEHCEFVQAYGDAIWIGGTSASGIDRVKISDCAIRTTARNGITISTNAKNIRILNTEVKWPITTALDNESVTIGTEDVVARDCYFGLWWSDTGTIKTSVSIDGGSTLGPGPRDSAKGYRIEDCTIEGCVIIADAFGVQMRGNRIRSLRDPGYPCVYAYGAIDDVWIVDNEMYDRSVSNNPVNGVITINEYAASAALTQARGVHIRGNRIRARNGRDGIYLRGMGGTPGDSGTATAVDADELTDSGKSWTTDAYAGHIVRMGGAQASIISNTGTVLTLSAAGWQDDVGGILPTPTAGSYTIYPTTGVIDCAENHVDLVDEDNGGGNGQFGIFITAPAPGARVRVRGNTVRGGDTRGIRVVPSVSSANVFVLLEIVDNHVYDDQATPTCTQGVSFNAPTNLGKLVLRNNSIGGGTTTAVNGLTSGRWLIDESKISTWGGYGSPEGVVAAPIGSQYFRADATDGLWMYGKRSGTSTAGWVPIGGVPATGSIVCVAKTNLVDGETVTIGDGITPPRVYEFDVAGDGVSGDNIAVDISAGGITTAGEVATVLANAINANQPALAAINASGTITITHDLVGPIGNVTITDTVANASFTVTGMSGGVNPAR